MIFDDVPVTADAASSAFPPSSGALERAQPGDYVRVHVDSAGVTTLTATALARTTLAGFHATRSETSSPGEEQVYAV